MKRPTILILFSFLALIFITTTIWGQEKEVLSDDDKRLNKIYTLAQKHQLYFFARGQTKSYIMMGTSFKKVDFAFYQIPMSDYLEEGEQYPDFETLKKLIEISRLKNYKVFLRNDKLLYEVTEENNIKKITEELKSDYFPEATTKEKDKVSTKDETKSSNKKDKRGIPSLTGGFHYLKMNAALKKVSIGSSYTVTSFLAYSPYYKFYSLPLSLMFQLGFFPIRGSIKGSTEVILSIETTLFVVGYYPFTRWAPALYLGYGRQKWTKVNQNYNALHYGLGFWTRPFLPFVDEFLIEMASIKRIDGTVSDVKIGIGISF